MPRNGGERVALAVEDEDRLPVAYIAGSLPTIIRDQDKRSKTNSPPKD